MGYREEQDKRYDEKDANLIAKIREAGFNVECETFCRTRDGEVRFEDKLVAVISRNTGSSSWRNYHEGWRIKCPHYKPRGHHKARYRRESPNNPYYWGGRNVKLASSVITKLVEAKAMIPSDHQIREGKALKAWREACRKVESAKRDLAYNFNQHNTDFIRYVLDLLPDTATLVPGKMLNDLIETRKDLERLDDEIAAMRAREEELKAIIEESQS